MNTTTRRPAIVANGSPSSGLQPRVALVAVAPSPPPLGRQPRVGSVDATHCR